MLYAWLVQNALVYLEYFDGYLSYNYIIYDVVQNILSAKISNKYHTMDTNYSVFLY